MDWKYKHFAQEAFFPAGPDIVNDAVRGFARDRLAGWNVAETPDGLEVKGRSAYHAETATFRIESAPGGTKVTVTLLVERASRLGGFMLFDVGGYYNGQLRQWLQALPWWIQQRLAATTPSAGEPGQAAPARPPMPKPSPAANLFFGCVFLFVTLGLLVYFIAALVGLLTGNLFLAGRGSGGTMIHGMWARILSAGILTFFGWIAFRIWKPKAKQRNRGSQWLPPP
jgi:hypothetical protein